MAVSVEWKMFPRLAYTFVPAMIQNLSPIIDAWQLQKMYTAK